MRLFVGDDWAEDHHDVELMDEAGRVVAALVVAGYTVYGVNPLQASRYRERHGVSGAKSDTGDAHMLTDMVRTDSHQLRAVAGDSPDAGAVKVVARAHKTLIWERTRQPFPRDGAAQLSPGGTGTSSTARCLSWLRYATAISPRCI